MKRREFLRDSSYLGAGAMFGANLLQNYKLPPLGHEEPDPGVKTRPNVIWILADQLRAQAIGPYGDPNARTPNLDRAAAMGVTFTNNVSGFPLCCPFRGSLLSSRYPHECTPGHQYPLPPGQKTIADVFNSNEYDTAYFGKWHLGGWQEANGRAAFFITDPDHRGGFKTWLGYENNNSQYDCWVHGGRDKDAVFYRLPGYETDALTDIFIKYIKDKAEEQKQKKDQPFFAVLSVQPPHNPYVAPPEFQRNYNGEKLKFCPNVARTPRVLERVRRELPGYYAMIENVDWNYGRVIQTLMDLGLYDNTHVMFFSDHGDSHGSHGMFFKTNPYEESVKTPMIISGCHGYYYGMKAGKAAPVANHVDIAPTSLGLCGIGKPEWMRGTDLSGYRVRKKDQPLPEPDSVYLQNVVANPSPDCINTPYRGLLTKDGWKYTCFENQSWMLFNLNDDPYEEANLAQNNEFKAERKRCIERLSQWVADTGDKFNIPKS